MAKCPKCGRGGVYYEPWGRKDYVAVCNFVRRCGWRMELPNSVHLSKKQRDKFVEVKGPWHVRSGE